MPMRTFKSKDARANWAALLRAVQQGETIVIQQYDRPVARLIPYKEDPMPNRFYVESHNSITDTTSREVDGHPTQAQAQYRADSQNSLYGSHGLPGPSYYVVEVDEDGIDVPPASVDTSTDDPELDQLIMGDRPE